MLVVDLVGRLPIARGLAYLGAGPVEDMVNTADDMLFGRILGAARTSQRFRRTLATIWIDDQKRIRELKVFFKK